ncbi:hypothetical protein BpHYR1_017127 [Brachionus plicatilis]|uniref:Uncharacterized protein n=1 Tax=Brachionus plicatilis TaxID=10195 RepID=A0A3M7S6R2_BRAPC|nr:hypothetical protein BpHYR1_017127 [Brachionus plicatilis]
MSQFKGIYQISGIICYFYMKYFLFHVVSSSKKFVIKFAMPYKTIAGLSKFDLKRVHCSKP